MKRLLQHHCLKSVKGWCEFFAMIVRLLLKSSTMFWHTNAQTAAPTTQSWRDELLKVQVHRLSDCSRLEGVSLEFIIPKLLFL